MRGAREDERAIVDGLLLAEEGYLLALVFPGRGPAGPGLSHELVEVPDPLAEEGALAQAAVDVEPDLDLVDERVAVARDDQEIAHGEEAREALARGEARAGGARPHDHHRPGTPLGSLLTSLVKPQGSSLAPCSLPSP